MMFHRIELDKPWPLLEEEILHFWEKENVFKKGLELSKNKPCFVFYEGPPTANGRPGIHHVLARIYKDLICRYKSMNGFHVPRKAGWDTHGLPVELEVEKRLQISGKNEIEAYGIAAFIEECKKSIFTYKEDWDQNTKRIAYWLDLDEPYITCTNDYIESIWWAIQQIYEKGLIVKGHKVVPHCPRCQTTLSAHEVAQGYDDNTVDPSVFVKFPVKDKENTYFLVWTTTPWTLTANVALAVKGDAQYVLIKHEEERLILAKERLNYIFKQDTPPIIEEFSGKSMVGKKYLPLFPYGGSEVIEKGCRVVEADFVGLNDGTGIVHLAPAFGTDDMAVGIEQDLPVLITVDLSGKFIDQVNEYRGIYIKDADKLIIRDLKNRKLLFRSETIIHTYPFCWRCKSALVYLAKDSWFIKTRSVQENLLQYNESVQWYPAHIKKGRFGEWLKDLKDWAISRERYWGTPLNIWECENCHYQQAVGSIKELEQLSQKDLSKLELHRPYIDEVTFKCTFCGAIMRRVKEVLDCWLDSGSMPFAQYHYPFENPDFISKAFPADFISEGIDQTRGWFYTLLVMNGILFQQAPYRSVLTFELVLDEKGEKMSKSRGNVVDVNEMIDKFGVDAIRWSMFFSSTPYVPRRFSQALVSDGLKNFILPLLNVASFFVTYANIDHWKPSSLPSECPKVFHLMDQWIVSRLERLVQQIGRKMDEVDITDAAKNLAIFLEDLTNWYIRRSRRRFWKSENDQDKNQAYETLYYVLCKITHLIAPFVPFVSEYLFQKLNSCFSSKETKSIHWMNYPKADMKHYSPSLDQKMEQIREWISAGLRARKKAGIKVRFPLISITIISDEVFDISKDMQDIIKEELNVKKVLFDNDLSRYAQMSIKPNLPVLGKKYGKQMPLIQKAIKELRDPLSFAKEIDQGYPVKLSLHETESIELGKEDLLFDIVSHSEQWRVESCQRSNIALDVNLTHDLVLEGFAREFIHLVQNERKSLGLEVTDLIEIAYDTLSGDIVEMFDRHQEYIQSETLSKKIHQEEQIMEATSIHLEAQNGITASIEFSIRRL